MRVLFYTEPAFERDNPNIKDGWVRDWIPRLSRSAQTYFGESYDAVLVTNTHLAPLVPDDCGLSVLALEQHQLYDLLHDDPLQDRIAAMGGKAHKKRAAAYGKRLKTLIDPFKPDIIISLSPAEHLRAAYPKTPLLHHEYGVFSRAPFPESWYFDPAGTTGCAWIDAHQDIIANHITDEDCESAIQIIQYYKDTLERINPYTKIINDAKAMYKNLVLLPMQFTGHAYFNALTPIRSQLQLATYVLEAVDENTGVFITNHKGGLGLSEDAMMYLKNKYPNTIIIENNEGYDGPSQYFAPYVQRIVTVSSTVGALKLIWGNALITLNDQYMKHYTDLNAADNNHLPWPRLDKMGYEKRNKQLAWLFKHHLFFDDDLSNPNKIGKIFEFYANQKANTQIYMQDDKINVEKWIAKIGQATANRFAETFIKCVENNDTDKVNNLLSIFIENHQNIYNTNLRLDCLFSLAMAHKGILNNYKTACTYFDQLIDECQKTKNADFADIFWAAHLYKAESLLNDGDAASSKSIHDFIRSGLDKLFGRPNQSILQHVEKASPALTPS